MADQLLLYPTTDAIDANGATRREVMDRGRVVEVWVARSAAGEEHGPRWFVLEFTGNATRAEQVAAYSAHRYREHAVEVWVMNYPGYGGSTGPAKLSRIAPAALAVFDELRRHAQDRPVVVAGNSIGTTAALYVAAKRDVAGVVLQNPPPLKDLILGQHGWWNLWIGAGAVAARVPGALDSVQNARKAKAPAVFVMAEKDEIVPPRFQRKVLKAYAGPKRVVSVSDAGHNSPVVGEAEGQLREAVRWMLEQPAGVEPQISQRSEDPGSPGNPDERR